MTFQKISPDQQVCVESWKRNDERLTLYISIVPDISIHLSRFPFPNVSSLKVQVKGEPLLTRSFYLYSDRLQNTGRYGITKSIYAFFIWKKIGNLL